MFGVASGGSAIATASMDNPQAILDLIDAVVKYSSDEFPQQIDPSMSLESSNG
jgi:hypothetical protein